MILSKKVIKEGQGLFRPSLRSQCSVIVRCKNDSSQLKHNTSLEFDKEINIILDDCDGRVDQLVHDCCLKMREKETLEIEIDITDCDKVSDDKGEDDEDIYTLEISLLSFTKAKELWELTAQERLDLAFQHKTKGTEFFKMKKRQCAFERFRKAAKYVISVGPENAISDDIKKEWKKCGSQVFLNLAACQLQTHYYDGVIENCTRALMYDDSNIKAYFRRAQARIKLKLYDEAKFDLHNAQKIEPNNSAVEKLLKHVDSHLKAEQAIMSNAMGKMFTS